MRQSSSLATAAMMAPDLWFPRALAAAAASQPLQQFGYGDVDLASDLHEKQLEEALSVLMGLNEDSLLKPFRQMTGQAAPGIDLGGNFGPTPHGRKAVGLEQGCGLERIGLNSCARRAAWNCRQDDGGNNGYDCDNANDFEQREAVFRARRFSGSSL